MKSMVSAATGFLLSLATSGAASAEDANAAVRAGMAVYGYIVKIEAMIDVCRRTDIANAASYDRIYKQYEDEIGGTIVSIGLLIGQASRRAGIDKQSLFKVLDASIDRTIETTEQLAAAEPERFSLRCKTLPKAIIERKKPFEPLTVEFPREMKIIQGRL